MQDDPDFVTALARVLRILTCFQAQETELGTGELAARSGLARATVARLTYTLAQVGYLRTIPLKRKYALSANVLSIGHPVLTAFPERGLARMHVKQLADDTGGHACLAVLEGLNAVYIEAVHIADDRHGTDIGTHRPLLESSVGRALYAAMAPAQKEAVLNRLCVLHPARTDELKLSAAEADADFQRYGMCYTNGVVRPGWIGLAMPIKGLKGHTIAISLGIQHAGDASHDEILRKYRLAVASAAARIESTCRAADRTNAPKAVAINSNDLHSLSGKLSRDFYPTNAPPFTSITAPVTNAALSEHR